MRVFRIHFEDNGQDFLTWDVDLDGNVIDCKPFQGGLWQKAKVTNIDELEVGAFVRYNMPHLFVYNLMIAYPIVELEALEING